MSSSQPGPIRRLLVGSWNLLNFTRRLVFNLLFLFVLVFLLVMALASPEATRIAGRSAAAAVNS